MYRALPVGNKLCAARMQKMQEERHRQGLRDVKKQIDTGPPKALQYRQKGNGKRDQLVRERYDEIEEENRRILFRMHEEFQKPPQYLAKSTSLPALRAPGDPTPQRRREVEHIARENLLLLHRIQTMKPDVTSNVDLAARHKNHKKYLQLKCEYPLVSFRPKSLSPFQSTGRTVTEPFTPDRLPGDRGRSIFSSSSASLPHAHHLASSGMSRQAMQASDIMRDTSQDQSQDDLVAGRGFGGCAASLPEQNSSDPTASPLEAAFDDGIEEPRLQHFFREEMSLGDLIVQVEMVSDGRVLAISAFDLDSEDSYELLLSEANHVLLHEEAGGDYGKIAQNLRLENGQLVLEPLNDGAYNR